MIDLIVFVLALLLFTVPLVVGIGALYMLMYAAKSLKDAVNTPVSTTEKKL